MRIPLLSVLLLFPISAAASSEQFLNYGTFVFDEVKAVVSYARDVDQNDKSSFALGIIGSSSIKQSNGLGTPSVVFVDCKTNAINYVIGSRDWADKSDFMERLAFSFCYGHKAYFKHTHW